jgi:hypothetical protein
MLSLLGRRVGVGTGRQRRRDDNVCEAVGVVVYKKPYSSIPERRQRSLVWCPVEMMMFVGAGR